MKVLPIANLREKFEKGVPTTPKDWYLATSYITEKRRIFSSSLPRILQVIESIRDRVRNAMIGTKSGGRYLAFSRLDRILTNAYDEIRVLSPLPSDLGYRSSLNMLFEKLQILDKTIQPIPFMQEAEAQMRERCKRKGIRVHENPKLSVRAADLLAAIESYPHNHHLVSHDHYLKLKRNYATQGLSPAHR